VKEILDTHGHIDILVNNAGMSLRSEIVNTDMKVDIQIMLVNYFGSVALTKAVLPSMISRKKGAILFIGSVQGKFGIPERSSYSASKHALQAFSEVLRAEVARHNIHVSIAAPGYVKTNFSLNAVSGSGENYGKMDESTANGVDPLELARTILNRNILKCEKENMLCDFYVKAAAFLHYFTPNLFAWIMARRALKLSKAKSD
jgi:dehydrogenase/reductase SDR family member 7B